MSVVIIEVYKHEWTVSVGDWKFGVEELQDYILRLTSGASTTVHIGPTSFETNLSAYQVLGIATIGSLILLAVVAFVVSRAGRGSTT